MPPSQNHAERVEPTPTQPTRRLSDHTERVADILCDILIDAGVDTVFGIPGGPIAPINDALLDRPQVRSVTNRHENSALFAAAGYARTSGKLGVALVTSGPGVLNAMTGLGSAYCDGVPVLLLVGEVPRHLQGKGALQDGSAHNLNIIGITEHISKLALEVPSADAAPALLHRAIATAMSGRQGPVVLTLPMDVLTARIAVPAVAHTVSTQFRIEPLVLDRVEKALLRSQRGVIFAGSGVRHGRGPQLLREVAERLQWPVMTTPKGKGVFPDSHPLALGVFGMGGHPSTRAYLQDGIETVLAIGTSLGDLATDGWSELLEPARDFIHVDIDATQVGRAYAAHLTIVASAEVFCDAMLNRLPMRPPRAEFGITYYDDAEAAGDGPEGRITPQRAIWEIQQVMPEDTIYCIDSGEHYFFATHYLRINRPDSYIVQTGLGSMGASIGAAIGAKLAAPERPVAVICGDGGFAMVAAEITTAAAHDLPIHVFVFDDQRLGMVELGHAALYSRSPSYSTAPFDVGEVATALGAETHVALHTGEAGGAIVGSGSRTTVVDVRIDTSVKAPKNKRFEGLRKVA